ncbi:DUF4062 domain-containing protein [Streptococcus sp. CF8_St5-17]|jgi:hypothetical protein|uniref:DUF4062 domain-containing protein n=1 Tax=Streptococcus sp. CF8_St5-17 TaxID=2963155 RepID=UPI0020C89144|nr:DUF4062 domain-containing protein [Streptococcus sp. CF8_St5-17]MCP9015911.1 DUF4062 domain-containing protein [Streptococcus sp. CF8_St5-17]
MSTNKVKDPIIVFISSKCDGKYREMRKRLSKLINDSPLMNSICYEEEGSRSVKSEEFYVNHVKSCDVCLIIIDNEDGISPSVLKEIDTAKKHNKKCLYFFCTENSSEKTQLQEDLYAKEKFSEIPVFDQIPEKVIESIVGDIIFYYRNKNSDTVDYKISDINTDKYSSTILDISKESKVLCEYLFKVFQLNLSQNENKISNIEQEIIKFFQFVFNKHKFLEINLDILEEYFVSKTEEELKEILTQRFNALKLYFRGDLNGAISILSDSLVKATDDVNIPKWIVNNIAIDLRNVQNEKGNYENRWPISNTGQEYINKSKEPLYFPLLDRREKMFFEQIDKFHADNLYSESVKSYNLCNIGLFQWISESFILSLGYASITHIQYAKNLMKVLLRTLTEMYDDYEFKIELFVLAVTSSDKELANFLLKSKQVIGTISSEEIEYTIGLIRNIEFFNNRLRSQCYLLRYFSDYINDSIIASFLMEFKGEVIKWLNQDNRELNLEKPIFDSLKQVITRFNYEDTIVILNIIFEKKLIRFYDSAFSLLSRMDYRGLTNQTQKKVGNYFIFKNNEYQLDTYGSYSNALINYLRNSTIDNTNLLRYIEDNNSVLMEKINLELEHNTIPEKYIDKYIEDIISFNRTQGKNGIFTFSAVNNFQTIFNIIKLDNVKLSEETFNRLIDVCKQTIISDNQILSDKYSSFNLLFQIYFSQIHDHNWEKLTDVFQSNRNTLLVQSDLIDENPIILSIQLNVMKSICDGNYNLVINDILKLSDENIIEIKRLVSFLKTIFEFNKFSPNNEFIMFCTYFCLNMTKHYSRNIKMNATDLLIKLTKYEIVNQIILNQLSNMMDCSNSDIKLVIVKNIDKINSNGNYKEYIIEKAKLDNHYLVIKYANEYRMENSNE